MQDRNVKGYLKQIAEKLNGNYTEYTEDLVIITIPLEGKPDRFQSVKALITEKEGQLRLIFTSTVCRIHEYPNIDFRHLLEENYDLIYAKICITDEDYLEVMSSINYDLCTLDELYYMILETVKKADALEAEVTEGKDVH
ncbi:MAG: hypothetical protein NZ551_06565 [Microscillaceae bacterium]|nr:hypothetical protein [Microscillaceae bacterium]MDW8460856.1 hypothetical protein [Cytophagales bacterium]